MLLSIIPTQTSTSSESKKPNLTEKRFSFSSPFSQITKNKAAIDTDNISQVNKRIGIHVAGPEILLPLINRPDEVRMLLENTESGTSIYQQLQKVHLPYSKEWDSVQQTLFKQGREEVSDREWLRELHSIIFTRSPRLWCHFSECIGARDVHFEGMDDGMELTVESEDVFEVQLPTFEVLKQLPSTFRKPVDQIDTISIDDCRCNENEHVDELTESIKGQEVRHISSNQTSEAFLGLRIRLRSRSEPSDGQGNISPLSIGVSADTAVIRNTRSRSRTTSTMNSLPFKNRRRLSQLFLLPTLQESTSSPIEIPQPKLSLHGRHRSASSKGESEMFDDEAPSHQWYRQSRQRDLECGRTEPVGLLLNRNPTWQPFVPPSEGIAPPTEARQSNSKNENKNSANLEGLLPDGRTRHPSAGSGDLKASLATFRKDNQTTETSSGSASPDSINLSPSASMRIDVDSNGHLLRWPSNEVLPISPITDSSDRSMPQTPGENHTILSPARFIKPLSSEGQTFSDPLNAVFRSPNINIPKQAPSTVIFPVPPCAQISRVKELTNQLNNIQQYFDENDKDKQTIMDAFAILQSTIGLNGINQLNTLIKKAGERDCTTDEDLLRSIASNCFGLVDMDLAIENGGKILCGGGGSGFDKHKRIEAEQKMKKQPWYTIQNDFSDNIAEDDEIYQTDQDHEARVQTYYEDVDAYAKRFVAFDALLSTIWNVDCTIMHTVRQRCGPVGHFDLKQHKQITRMSDKYLTKATF